MADAFEVLSHDHEEVQQIMTQLEQGSTGGGEAQLAARKDLAEQLVIEESRHEDVEEMYFWPMVRERLPNGSELANKAVGQEEEGKQMLDRLDKMDAADPEFAMLLTTFIHAARKHIQYEETQVWPALRSALSSQDAAELGRKLEDGKKTAPTTPHPHTPAAPGVL